MFLRVGLVSLVLPEKKNLHVLDLYLVFSSCAEALLEPLPCGLRLGLISYFVGSLESRFLALHR